MSINADKCTHLAVNCLPAKKQLYVVSKARVFVGAEAIPVVGPEDLFKYLGFRYSYMDVEPSSSAPLAEQLARVRHAPLKPYQKLEIIRVYLLPRLYYTLQSPSTTRKTLIRTNKIVRAAVKTILHLPAHTTNSFIYCDLGGRGLGIPCFAARMPDILFKRLHNLSHGGF